MAKNFKILFYAIGIVLYFYKKLRRTLASLSDSLLFLSDVKLSVRSAFQSVSKEKQNVLMFCRNSQSRCRKSKNHHCVTTVLSCRKGVSTFLQK